MQFRSIMTSIAVAALAACGGDSTGPGGLTPVAELTIADLPDTLLTRQGFRLMARAADDDGTTLPDRPLTWASSDPAVVSITAGGVLTAMSPGVATVSVSTGTTVDSADVTVRALTFVHVFTSRAVSCGLEASGEAWCWGNVGAEGYGNGSLDTTRALVPSRAARGHTFSSLAIAPGSACGVELSGGVVCWGANEHGQLGDGTTTAQNTPVSVSGVSNAVQLVAGVEHYCARSAAGDVTCWGSNEWKQAGQEARALVTQPHAVPLSGPATDLSAGDQHTCALVSGVNNCWGADYSRQLGNDTTYDRLVPVLAATGDGTARTWSEVEASNHHTCGRTEGGATYCWGILEGQGDNDTTAWLPTRRFSDLVATDVAGGWFVQCVVSAQQEAWCDGKTFPRVKLAWDAPVRSVAVAGSLACVVDTAGRLGCEQDVTGNLSAIPWPPAVTRIVANDDQMYGLDTAGKVFSWLPYDPSPKAIFDTIIVDGIYASSGARVCALSEANGVVCRRGNYNAVETAEPTGALAFTSLAVGDDQTCGLTAAGAAWCWGSNDRGQLGDGTTTERATPVEVRGGHVFSQITAGWQHTCGLTIAGEIWCWGNGSWGSMGDDHRNESAAPVSVDGASPLNAISASCGLDAAGSAWCWPTTLDAPAAHQIPGATGLVSPNQSCGLRASGELLCWGSNYAGQFGDGTYGNTYTGAVPGGSGILFKEVSFGSDGTACGLSLDGATYCWGNGYWDNGHATVPEKMVGSR